MPEPVTELAGRVAAEPLAAWLDQVDFARGQPLAIERLSGGYANEMFRLRRGSRVAVLRRPSGMALARVADGLMREFRALSALDATQVPHPRSVALCEDAAVLGCSFNVMESVDGFSPVAPLPAPFDGPAGMRDVALAQLDALAAFHEVDWRAAGLRTVAATGEAHT